MEILLRAWSLAKSRLLWSWRFHSLGHRSFVGRCRLAPSARSVSIGHHTSILDDWSLVDLDPKQGSQPKIRIGSYCTILHDFQCNAHSSVDIGNHVLVAPRVFISDADHVVAPDGARTTLCREFRSAPVVIEDDCWLGVNAVVLKGVRIGHHSVVGANAVVTRDVPPCSTVVGIPAAVVSRAKANRAPIT